VAISVPLDTRAFSYDSPDKGGFVAEKGGFEIRVGSSSGDVRWKGPFALEQTTLKKPTLSAHLAIPKE
jgi:hypothetical protein